MTRRHSKLMLALPRRSLPWRKIMQAYIAKANGRIAQGRCTPAQRKTWLALMAFDAPTRLRLRISLLSSAEIDDVIMPCKQLVQKLCAGVATENQHIALTTHIAVALQIEQSGIVRGLREHLESANHALAAIRTRALSSGSWQSPSLNFDEADVLREAVDLHKHQLTFVSAGELHHIVKKLASRTKQQGGQVVRVSNEELGLQA